MAVLVSGTIKDYPWGMADGMVPWTGRGTGKPQAELWYGVHPAGPSRTLDGSTADIALAGSDVPLLVKILAAARPLSIQIHPDAARAVAGFAAQPPGVKIYSDAAAKNEILVAMSDFQALAGWRTPARAANVLGDLGYPAPVQEAARGARWGEAAELMMAGMPGPGPWDPGLVRRAIRSDDPLEAAALGDLASAYPHDPALGIAAILGYHRLRPSEAIYVPAGVPHAYLRGIALEVMTSSDNVLRLGLTTKEVAATDALAAIRPDLQPVLLTQPGSKAPTGAPFRVDLQRGVDASLPRGHYRVVLAIDGAVDVMLGERQWSLAIGQGLLIPAQDPPAQIRSDAMVALVEAVTGSGERAP